VFFIGHVYSDKYPGQEPVNHVFGGLIKPEDGGGGYSLVALDYGAPTGFDIGGKILQKKADQFVMLPITAESAVLYENLVQSMWRLDVYESLPFYFSRYLEYSPIVENGDQLCLNMEGEVIEREALGVSRFIPIDAYGQQFSEENSFIKPGKTYVRTNCAAMFNFCARRAGIDLTQLDPDWWEFSLGVKFAQVYREIFAEAASRIDTGGNIYFDKKDIGNSTSVWRGHYKSHEEFKPHVRDYLNAAINVAGGVRPFFDYFASMRPLQMEPAPVPDYLRKPMEKLAALRPV
jgi:hypothetical protein